MDNPSIFEIIQEDSLRKAFRSSIRQFVKFIFNRLSSTKIGHLFDNPSLSVLNKYFSQDETILLLETLIEWSFLYRYNSTFSERFLSLQRFDISNDNGQRLNGKQIFLSIVSLTFGPYLIKKLDDYYEYLTDKAFGIESEDIEKLNSRERQFYFYYKNIKKFYQFLRIISWISYATSSSSYPNPVMAILLRDVKINYSDEDVLKNSINRWFTYRIATSISNSFSFIFKSSAFLIQFIDYWLSQSNVQQMLSSKGSNGNIPSPQNIIESIDKDYKKQSSNPNTSKSSAATVKQASSLHLSPGSCPLCFRLRRNSTALSCSGYIFCYSCITDFVNQHSTCPISGFPANISQLIRIYD